MDDESKYRELFFEESDEYIQTLNDCLLELEKNPNEKSIIDEIFRAVHTLKGMAATMGYKTMQSLTHHMENVFSFVKDGTVKVSSEIITLLFKCLDKLLEIIEDLRNEKYIEYDIDDLLKELDNIGKKDTQQVKKGNKVDLTSKISDTDLMVINSAIDQGFNAYNIIVKLSEDCQLKGARSYLVVNRLEGIGEIIHSDPAPEKLEEGEFDFEFRLIFLSKQSKDIVFEKIDEISEIDDIIIEEIDKDFSAGEEKTNNNPDNKIKKTKLKDLGKTEINTHNHANQSIRVDLSRLDHFMNLVSELVIYRNRLDDISSRFEFKEINSTLEQITRITSDLQDLVLKIRMQPVSVVFNRFPRMMRDLSKDLEKEFEFAVEGEETELDRTVISELGEPLVHLLRNAADHGIEHAEDRVILGKPKSGLIKLTAYQEGNKVVITVSDDGGGIKSENIGKIFDQGFSTTKEVNNISGRGVGMDVVKQKILSLGGSIDVKSEVNKGSIFTINLPLTLSIIQSLMIKVGEEIFALPLGIIEKVVEIENEEIIKSHANEVYIYRDQAIPVIRLDKKLSIESNSDEKHLIIISLGSQPYGLLVDELIGQQEIVIKKLGGVLKNVKEYLGATILGNGDIILILDVGNICAEGKIE
jgi:two-component system chemotaxis sensor kinase CheA